MIRQRRQRFGQQANIRQIKVGGFNLLSNIAPWL